MKKLFLSLLLLCQCFGELPEVAILQEFNEKIVCEVMAKQVPDLSIQSLTLHSNGWDHFVAEINGEWIVRFPRSDKYLPILQREKILLDHIRPQISLPIPFYEHMGSQIAFGAYRKLQGEPLTETVYGSLSPENRQSVAESLALFFTQLHHTSIEVARDLGYPLYHLPLNWIEYDLLTTLEGPIKRIVEEALNYARQNPVQNKKLVLLHNDIHGENIAFQQDSNKITGIFDFSDAAIGDFTIDLAKLFMIHKDLAIRVSEVYAKLNSIPNPLIPVAVDYILRLSKRILEVRESAEYFKEARLIQMLQQFAPAWDELQHSEISFLHSSASS